MNLDKARRALRRGITGWSVLTRDALTRSRPLNRSIEGAAR